MKHIKFNDNRSFLTKIADLNEKLSKCILKLWPIIFILIILGIAGHFEMEDEICKNPSSKQCIEYNMKK